MANDKLTDIELAKIIMDPRRSKILQIAKESPVTVSAIAEAINEKPSRLYYHVKMLEDAGMLELTETKQHGNLIEKYYKTVPGRKTFDLDKSLLAEHSDSVKAEIMKVVEPGLKKLFQKLDDESSKEQVDMAINFTRLTGKEWLDSFSRMTAVIKENTDVEPSSPKNDNDHQQMSKEALAKKSRYVHVVLSYKIDEEDEAIPSDFQDTKQK